MEKLNYYKHWYNSNHGLELKPDHVGIRTNENAILFHVVYMFLREWGMDIPTIQTIRKLRAFDNKGNQIDGIYDRSYMESINGSPYQRPHESRIRTGSRDNMQAIAAIDPIEAQDIVEMGFKSLNRYPNHFTESLGIKGLKHIFKAKYWENFQYQVLWDMSFYALMSKSKIHNLLGLVLFPIYWLIQFTIPLQKYVTRPTLIDWIQDRIRSGKWPKREKQPKNSGDQLFFVRDYALRKKYGKFYSFLISPQIQLFRRKWSRKEWDIAAIYNYHVYRKHSFPVTFLLEDLQ